MIAYKVVFIKRILRIPFNSAIIATLLMLSLGTITTSAAPDGFNWAKIYDPVNDCFGSSPQHDVSSFFISKDASTVSLIMSFVGAITPPFSGGDEVRGIIDLDTDQNPSTGAASHLLTYPQCQNPNLGIEFYIDLENI